ncbi:MAG: Hydrolase, alpha/beta domain protein [Candidatus Amesbacteria bacterium GW2011_GWA1_47_16]|uniref:Hydrolase, alpha/beta domain protein n=3 Tax=Candidatus Amesiibacteriota TaxID=1752730 RepID=A0A0G1S3L3_9BACT|nr:MAG: Hydrolase, alpha/beta domain protein [Candidatus Amesbacteria bacterium GW2011_GWC1_47_15]KKU64423.1 MAG: Hydrolase, alpha/beta domain protein [Candidatus Amesbacteria bacterium GW2011_GWA1_47_16]KKU97485.1 MAG: Hydrolase, alpha/beta domain protein [Candidatus Amesbacteria bacterium GW2011_GWB1_48_13]
MINYQIVGHGKTDMLILHGWQASLEEWKPTADYFKDKYRVFLVDLPGFGGSSRPNTNWGIFEYADFVMKLIKIFQIKTPVLLGHSFGGRIGIILASQEKIVISKLVLVDAAGMELKSFKTKFLGVASTLFKWLPKSIKSKLGSSDYKNVGDMKHIFVKIINQPLRLLAKEINISTLIIWGERDQELSLSEAKLLHKNIQKSKLRIVWGTGHWPHRDEFEDFVNILFEEGI